MTTGSILLSIALLIVVLLFVLRPFLTPTLPNPTLPRQKLLTQKESLLEQIRALDFDYSTDKIAEEVYQPQRAGLIREAALVLQQLDSQTAVATDDIETAIETAVARLRQSHIMPTTTATDRLCPQCGQATDEGDKFCAACGHQLVEVVG